MASKYSIEYLKLLKKGARARTTSGKVEGPARNNPTPIPHKKYDWDIKAEVFKPKRTFDKLELPKRKKEVSGTGGYNPKPKKKKYTVEDYKKNNPPKKRTRSKGKGHKYI